RTVFEFSSGALGAQSGVGGGGRYDGLVQQIGGPATPGAGWAAGIERLLLSGGDQLGDFRRPVGVFVASAPDQRVAAFALAQSLNEGPRVEMDLSGRSIKGQLKAAARLEPHVTVILEGGEVRIRRRGHDDVVVADGADATQAALDAYSETVGNHVTMHSDGSVTSRTSSTLPSDLSPNA
ncbi:MAG: hypothetical protein JHD16_18745, partial [Solirubrobacteraceae bacterium]|nr:hypothetical protein [Solirubrobacteraceae bacterium]